MTKKINIYLAGMMAVLVSFMQAFGEAAQERERTWIRYDQRVQTHTLDLGDLMPEEDSVPANDPAARKPSLFRNTDVRDNLVPTMPRALPPPTARVEGEEENESENWLTPSMWNNEDQKEEETRFTGGMETIFEQYEEQLNQYSIQQFLNGQTGEVQEDTGDLQDLMDQFSIEDNPIQGDTQTIDSNLFAFEPVLGFGASDQVNVPQTQQLSVSDERLFADNAEILLEEATALNQEFIMDRTAFSSSGTTASFLENLFKSGSDNVEGNEDSRGDLMDTLSMEKFLEENRFAPSGGIDELLSSSEVLDSIASNPDRMNSSFGQAFLLQEGAQENQVGEGTSFRDVFNSPFEVRDQTTDLAPQTGITTLGFETPETSAAAFSPYPLAPDSQTTKETENTRFERVRIRSQW